MGHPTFDNTTAFAAEALFPLDAQGRPCLVLVVKGSFDVHADGSCSVAEEQVPVCLDGVHWGEPASSSYRYEPEIAFTKPATDVVLLGHAYAPRPGTKDMVVSLRAGPLTQQARVFGDRIWHISRGRVTMSSAVPFERIALVYERAFGGWERRELDVAAHRCEPRNPVGTGFCTDVRAAEHVALPNIENPRKPITAPSERPEPVGFGFTAPHWQPRAALAGTYDEAWQQTRAPLLPVDFDLRHLNAAPARLIAPGYFRGDETIHADGVTARGTFMAQLPGPYAPQVRVGLHARPEVTAASVLDTIIVEPDERRLLMLWRTSIPLSDGPHDVAAIDVSVAPPAPDSWRRSTASGRAARQSSRPSG